MPEPVPARCPRPPAPFRITPVIENGAGASVAVGCAHGAGATLPPLYAPPRFWYPHNVMPTDPRALIVELCRQFYAQGWVSGTGGGISIRDGDRAYVAPSGVQKERISPADLFVVDLDANVLERPTNADLRISACLPLFLN